MPLIRERRSVSYAVILGIWATTFLYCLLHDQYLVRIAPEHFTVYHEPLWGIADPALLAAAWAFRASIGPGLIMGMAALFVGRAGRGRKVPVGTMLRGYAVGLGITEIAGLAAGAWSWFTGRTLYPEIVYPELTRALITTQSIQLTCYLAGVLVGIGYLVWLNRSR
ncbi:hypothetical protein [Haloferula sp. A504]|uniref:hypothetical protein n=1 Tax=Haloferula sp. A504 TaxID=3373601 RepID=UPI0031BF27C3|nr:hypothetical protein [Verrucomicrobiaceae bacterium E54]